MAVGRPHGDAIYGAVLVGCQRITCDLASLRERRRHGQGSGEYRRGHRAHTDRRLARPPAHRRGDPA
eukprot:1137117-Prymnesium_polylepis.1